MEIIRKPSVFKFINTVLSLILAVSIVVLSFSVVFLSSFNSKSVIDKSFKAYTSQTIEAVNEKLVDLSKSTGFPEDAYTSCFSEETASLLMDEIINNIYFTYSTNLSDDEELYNSINANLTKYCYDNKLNVATREITMYSALAVDAVNEVMGGSSTAKIEIIKFTKKKIMITLIVVPFVLIVACLYLIDLMNKGRHRRINYYGLGITTGGAVISAVSLFSIFKNYAVENTFCQNYIYDLAIADVTNFSLKICATIGIVFVVIGFVLLFVNYQYYKDKKKYREERAASNLIFTDDELSNSTETSDKELNSIKTK